MKTNKLWRQVISVALVLALSLSFAMLQTSAQAAVSVDAVVNEVVKSVDSYITLDAYDQAYVGNDGAKDTGLYIGEEQGLHLENGTEYEFTINVRVEKVQALTADTGVGTFENINNNQNTMIRFFTNGDESNASYGVFEFLSDGESDYLNSSDNSLKPYNAPLNEWLTYKTNFTTTTKSGDKWLALMIFGGFKLSYNLTIKKVSDGTVVLNDLSDLDKLPELADFRGTTSIYEGAGAAAVETNKYPKADVIVHSDDAILTFDTTNAYYRRPSDSLIKLNAVKIGKKQGIDFEVGNTYNIAFKYRIEEFAEIKSGDEKYLSDNLRTPIIHACKDGNNYASILTDKQLVTNVEISKKQLNPIAVKNNNATNIWFDLNFEFTPAQARSDGNWFLLYTLGGMRVSYKEFTVTDSENNTVTYQLGRIKDYDFNVTTVYNDTDADKANGTHPEIIVSTQTLAGDADGDNQVNVKDILRLKKFIKNVNGVHVELGADCNINYGVDNTDFTGLRELLLNK